MKSHEHSPRLLKSNLYQCEHCGALLVRRSARRTIVAWCSNDGGFTRIIRVKKSGRGGARANAGRKAAHGEAKQDKNIALTPTLWAFLTRDGETAGSAIEAHYRKTAAFKAWLKSQAAE